MGRYKNCQEILTYYAEANRMCLSIKPGECGSCPLKEGGGCGKTIFSFALTQGEERAKDIHRALYKIFAVQTWSDEHPEEEEK